MSDARGRIVREARRFWGREAHRRIDWSAVDRGLFARIERQEHEARRALFERQPRARGWTAIAIAATAALALGLIGQLHAPRPLDTVRADADDEAGSVVSIDGDGDALIGGRKAVVGEPLKLGDVVQTRGAQVTVGRPGKLTFVVERDSSARVTHVRGALVLSLAAGAVEAQVVPVSKGEAFAVDLGRARVAVHGTHLRVARSAAGVVVDLSDGVVSVGDAPRVGPTLGALVAAPAHAEFSEADAQGTLHVTHEAAAVRAPVALGQGSPLGRSALAATDLAPPRVPAHAEVVAANAGQPGLAAAPHAETRPATGAPAPPPAPAMPPADPNASANLGGLVKACMAEHLHAEDVTITISTTLYLELRDDGTVRSARFDPPVAPDVNACVARSMYRTRFTHGGAVTIPVSFKN